METSEFGKGFTYCIGLFLMHYERMKEYKKLYSYEDVKESAIYGVWFNGAADHLFDLEVPENISKEFKHRILKWKAICIQHRLAIPKEEDFLWSIKEAKEILIEWDKHCGIGTIVGDYE